MSPLVHPAVVPDYSLLAGCSSVEQARRLTHPRRHAETVVCPVSPITRSVSPSSSSDLRSYWAGSSSFASTVMQRVWPSPSAVAALAAVKTGSRSVPASAAASFDAMSYKAVERRGVERGEPAELVAEGVGREEHGVPSARRSRRARLPRPSRPSHPAAQLDSEGRPPPAATRTSAARAANRREPRDPRTRRAPRRPGPTSRDSDRGRSGRGRRVTRRSARPSAAAATGMKEAEQLQPESPSWIPARDHDHPDDHERPGDDREDRRPHEPLLLDHRADRAAPGAAPMRSARADRTREGRTARSPGPQPRSRRRPAPGVASIAARSPASAAARRPAAPGRGTASWRRRSRRAKKIQLHNRADRTA